MSAKKTPTKELFTNSSLNRIFCATEAETQAFCREALATFKRTLGLVPDDEKEAQRIVAFMASLIESAFELGQCDAYNDTLARARRNISYIERQRISFFAPKTKGGAA